MTVLISLIPLVYRRKVDEGRFRAVGDNARQRGLADARRSPKIMDEIWSLSISLRSLALADQMLLSDKIPPSALVRAGTPAAALFYYQTWFVCSIY